MPKRYFHEVLRADDIDIGLCNQHLVKQDLERHHQQKQPLNRVDLMFAKSQLIHQMHFHVPLFP